MKIKTTRQIRHEAFLRKKYLWGIRFRCARYVQRRTLRTWKCDEIDTRDPSTFYDANVVELAAALERDELLTGVPLGSEPVTLNFKHFDRGIEARKNCPGKPCEPDFLEALVRDCCLLIWEFRSFCRDTEFNSMDDPLPTKYADIFCDLNKVFDECRRLKNSPELFTTLIQERQFMKKMSRVAEIVDHLRDVILFKKKEGLIDRKVNDTLEDFPAPGAAFEHMAYSRFSTMAVNYVQYKAGYRSETDKNGILRVEQLAQVVQQGFGRQQNPVIMGNANVPYHRFMMGYKVETPSEDAQ
ncbi:hypothetical protein SBOR_9075 [Sclerotinia borealis F-4128]|uniref:Uncharacterized protein n=1 Tax=Sclerotinia borealis (strain F-4128) TaxID=1432307 RepID=W9C3S9_SCLBF|nr:hypothetical protein SBOR_9075 [Sclerotinia borealis F-4128]